MKKGKIALFIASVGLVGIYTPIHSSAEEVKVVGTFEATILDVKIPATTTFIYNPNTEEMISDHINIQSETNAPIYSKMKEINISEESIWKPQLVSPDKYTDDQWNNLTQTKSKEEVALGVSPLESEEWLYPLEKDKIWTNEVKMGTIRNHGVVNVKPILKAGTSFTTEDLLTANYIFEFGLEEGEPLVVEEPVYTAPNGCANTIAPNVYNYKDFTAKVSGEYIMQGNLMKGCHLFDGDATTEWMSNGLAGSVTIDMKSPTIMSSISFLSVSGQNMTVKLYNENNQVIETGKVYIADKVYYNPATRATYQVKTSSPITRIEVSGANSNSGFNYFNLMEIELNKRN
ncbi:hypothetical protein CVD28_04395 [Bacillus sp. M6-12]|uniref:hypothetical protein n=1 Tax=Bacillus sp. M6-12 TaxID=2054166 RepID=UPI000C791FB2|nr:hypothetical protein [Bacillus sp. M6-12]PLS19662.1 hypothetical protein CVD28_04395 [Bacillus sp. M6-12]